MADSSAMATSESNQYKFLTSYMNAREVRGDCSTRATTIEYYNFENICIIYNSLRARTAEGSRTNSIEVPSRYPVSVEQLEVGKTISLYLPL